MKINISFDFTISLILTLIFFVLKQCNVINWAWYWIISPIWITLIIMVITLAILKFKGLL